VLADQVDPTGSSPDAGWLPTGPSTERVDQGAGVVAHLTHCIDQSRPTTSPREHAAIG